MSLNSTRLLLRSRASLRSRHVCLQCRFYASESSTTTTPGPALLVKIKTDLKTAMKAKDTNRLNVLRGLIAEVTNAAKTSNPIKSDMQLLSLLRKRSAAAKDAENEFKAAGREDLVEKEHAQVEILDEYASSVEMMDDSDIKDAVNKVVEEAKALAQGKVNMGDVLKKLVGAGGSLEGRPVDRSTVARIVKQVLGQEK